MHVVVNANANANVSSSSEDENKELMRYNKREQLEKKVLGKNGVKVSRRNVGLSHWYFYKFSSITLQSMASDKYRGKYKAISKPRNSAPSQQH